MAETEILRAACEDNILQKASDEGQARRAADLRPGRVRPCKRDRDPARGLRGANPVTAAILDANQDRFWTRTSADERGRRAFFLGADERGQVGECVLAEQLRPEAICAGLQTTLIAGEVVCFAQIPSTMDEARRRAAANAAEGLVVLAEEQTAGRGRLGRRWAAPPGSALLLSLLLRPRWLPPERAFALTMLAATALCDAVEETTALRPALKWPNDMLLAQQNAGLRIESVENSAVAAVPAQSIENVAPTTLTENFLNSQFSTLNSSPQAKAAGILAELHLRSGAIDWAIIGIGVNVHAHPPPDQTSYPAISLDAALGERVERLPFLRALLRHLDEGYAALREGGYDALFATWRARLATLGQAVHIATPAQITEGVAEDVAATGALMVRTADGALHTVTVGDVQA